MESLLGKPVLNPQDLQAQSKITYMMLPVIMLKTRSAVYILFFFCSLMITSGQNHY